MVSVEKYSGGYSVIDGRGILKNFKSKSQADAFAKRKRKEYLENRSRVIERLREIDKRTKANRKKLKK